MTRQRRCRWGFVSALLALFCQIFGAGVMAVDAVAATDSAGFATVICHGGDGPSGPATPERHHGAGECALCPVCQALGHAGSFVPPEPPRLHRRSAAEPVALPAALTGPPTTRSTGAAQPRGPPSI
jgi:hypothetical protein